MELAGAALIGVSALGLGRGLTAHPSPNGHVPLRRSGLYRWMRHPMYTGVMALTLGAASAAGSLVRTGGATALIALFNVKARVEERSLAAHFPEYVGYASVTPRFLPRPAHRPA